MTNRHDRRAGKATDKKAAGLNLPQPPNISGCAENCENCRFSVPKVLEEKIIKVIASNNAILGKPKVDALPYDEVHCLKEPQGWVKKVWGWCAEWKERVTV